MTDKVRQISERSLENLKLGAQSRYQGKQRHNFTVLPETVQWLKGTGNASDAIDVLVEAAKSKGLLSSNTHGQEVQDSVVSSNVYEQKIKDLELSLEETYLELSKVRSQLQTEKALHSDMSNLHHDCMKSGFQAADILKAALKIPSNTGGAIKVQIREALKLIDDV